MTPAELRDTRKGLGLTQQGMADLMGVNISTIQKYEKGKYSITKVMGYAARWVRDNYGR